MIVCQYRESREVIRHKVNVDPCHKNSPTFSNLKFFFLRISSHPLLYDKLEKAFAASWQIHVVYVRQSTSSSEYGRTSEKLANRATNSNRTPEQRQHGFIWYRNFMAMTILTFLIFFVHKYIKWFIIYYQLFALFASLTDILQ